MQTAATERFDRLPEAFRLRIVSWSILLGIGLTSTIIRPEAFGEEYQILAFRFEESRDGLLARSLGCPCWPRQSFVGNTARDVFLSFWSDLRSVL